MRTPVRVNSSLHARRPRTGSRSRWRSYQAQARAALRLSTALLAIFLVCASHYLNRSFGKPDIDQIACHLSYGVDAMSSADPVLVERFVRWCVLGPLALLMLIALAEWRWGRAPASGLHRLLRAWPAALLFAALWFWCAQLSVPS